MEEHLDSLPPSERSRFIRAAISDLLDKDDIVRPLSAFDSPPSNTIKSKVTQSDSPLMDKPLFEEGYEDDTDLDLESKLNNLDF